MGRLALGAAAFAVAELAAGLLVGRFFAWGRAEALLFFAFRPWLLLAAAFAVRHWTAPRRALFYGAALLTAGLAESLFLLPLGGDPWVEMLRGWAAGAALALPMDLVVQAGRRLGGRAGPAAGATLLALLLVIPGALRPYERLALGRTGPSAAGERPDFLVMTSLPLVWGEGGAFDPASRPAAAWQALEREFAPRPVDYLDEAALASARLLLLAQPRLLAPEELVAIDAWIRRGGRALILADPALEWPGALPLGDARRPVSSSLLGPLLRHWGVALAAGRPGPAVEEIDTGRGVRRLAMLAPGRFEAAGPQCAPEADFVLRCRIGAGEAILVADADLLHDRAWTGPGPRGGERHLRTADNPLAVADWLDRLAGIERPRALGSVRWLAGPARREAAVALAALPILAALVGAFFLARVGRGRRSTELSTGSD